VLGVGRMPESLDCCVKLFDVLSQIVGWGGWVKWKFLNASKSDVIYSVYTAGSCDGWTFCHPG